MKHINDYIKEEKKTTGAGATEMIKIVLNELKTHSDCKYDASKNEWVGKDKEVWQSAGQFVFDYLKELDKATLKKIVTDMGWENMVRDINDVAAPDVSMCISLYAQVEIIDK